MLPDHSRPARTNLDREYAYMAYGMVGGAVPGIVIGFLVGASAGHAAMWLSVFGGIGIVVGLVTGMLLHRRRRSPDQVTDRRANGAAPE